MNLQKKQEHFDDSLFQFAGVVTRAIEHNKDGTDQEHQVEELLAAERKFKEVILSYKHSTKVYKRFIQKIRVENKNILSARPYFRESGVNFSKFITPTIKDCVGTNAPQAIETLKTFDINFQFIKFVKDHWLGNFPPKALELYKRVEAARTVLIENNMPLAINRAKLFYRKTPRSQLSLMDMIQICSMGLAAGVDKWLGKYSPVFRSVCIGRMVGNLIDAYSETTLHFYPSDRRILYRANSIRGRMGIAEIKDLVTAVNESFVQEVVEKIKASKLEANDDSPMEDIELIDKDSVHGKSLAKFNVNVSELSDLLAAASTLSADSTVNDEGYGVYDYTMGTAPDSEVKLLSKESEIKKLALFQQLPLICRKILKLKGMNFDYER